MNRTKKRAAKRSAIRRQVRNLGFTPQGRRLPFYFPFEMTPENRMKNVKYYKEYYKSSIQEALIAVDAMIFRYKAQQRQSVEPVLDDISF